MSDDMLYLTRAIEDLTTEIVMMRAEMERHLAHAIERDNPTDHYALWDHGAGDWWRPYRYEKPSRSYPERLWHGQRGLHEARVFAVLLCRAGQAVSVLRVLANGEFEEVKGDE